MEMLPDWCSQLPDADQMREIDRWAIERRGVPSLELMERAGEAVVRAVERLCPDGPVAVLCGKGNNGGDGLVAARLLRELGRPVAVLTLAGRERLRGDALQNLERLPGPPPIALIDPSTAEQETPVLAAEASHALSGAAVLVDALLGTGFRGAAEGAAASAIEAIGRVAAPVVSVDVPSGLDASSGEVRGVAVSAAVTVAFHAGKPGLWIHPGKQRCGKVEVADIGIPRGAPVQASVGLLEDGVLDLLPRRGASSTKFTSGHVLVVGGSPGLTGAPRMAAEAAMRAGAGYVTACVPRSLQEVLAGGGRPEMMTKGMQEDEGALAPGCVEDVLAAAERGGALALGPGLGRSASAVESARRLAQRAQVAAVIDADGLNAHAGRLTELRGRDAETVLTPHAGELARLLQLRAVDVQQRRLGCALEAAAAAGAVVVLKGDDTVIADPSGFAAISPGGGPALATAGTGDVLSGVIAALLAAELPAFAAACAGVYMHLLAGRLAAQQQGSAEGVIASDVIAALPRCRGDRGHA